MQALLQQFLLKHGDILTIRTLHLNAGGTPGWLYLDSNETPQVAHGVDLPISDKRFQWQIIKLSPNVTGGNQDATYVTEGDDVLLKSLANNLVLTFHGKHCGLNVARAQVGEQIAIGNYYTSGQGGVSTLNLVDANGGATPNRAIVYGMRPYAIKSTNSHCFLSAPPHQQAATAGSASQHESFLLMPAYGTIAELEMRSKLIGDIPLITQEAAAQGMIDATHGEVTPFSQVVSGQQRNVSVMAVDLPGGDTPWIIGGSVVVVLILLAVVYAFARKSAK